MDKKFFLCCLFYKAFLIFRVKNQKNDTYQTPEILCDFNFLFDDSQAVYFFLKSFSPGI